jgi:hypothetical protein
MVELLKLDQLTMMSLDQLKLYVEELNKEGYNINYEQKCKKIKDGYAKKMCIIVEILSVLEKKSVEQKEVEVAPKVKSKNIKRLLLR